MTSIKLFCESCRENQVYGVKWTESSIVDIVTSTGKFGNDIQKF